jgi:glycosyltransferase involved in cell wall biosynthesis
MKLIIQIPCFNEEGTLKKTLADLPRKLQGFDSVEWLIINDGSADKTVEVAREAGVDHIVSHTVNRGLARAFMTGIEACLERGADVIVNTDADNQYCAANIPDLVAPILLRQADMVVGARPIQNINDFSWSKKILQNLGSSVVRFVSKTDVRDAPSGFRAFSRAAAQQLHVFNTYTYTLETIIQAGLSGLEVKSIPVNVNGKFRESRLIKSIPSYIRRSFVTICRILITYRPFSFFTLGALVFFLPGFALGIRFLINYFQTGGHGMIQSLILASLLMLIGALLFTIAIVSELIAVNRRLLERTRWQLHKLEDRLSRMSRGEKRD